MAKKPMLYTQEGFEELKNELTYLTTVRREEIKEAIAVARSYGDLSENSEYDEARTEQAKCEARIIELNELIENATIVTESEADHSVVGLGSIVKVYDEEFEEEVEYSVVGSNEVDPMARKISDQSPIGKALMGAKAGDEVVVETPAGSVKFKVLEVSRIKSHDNQ